MIKALDFDDLTFACGELLRKNPTKFIDEVEDTIRTDFRYAALTILAMQEAADNFGYDNDYVDNLLDDLPNRFNRTQISQFVSVLQDVQEERIKEEYISYSHGRTIYPDCPIVQ